MLPVPKVTFLQFIDDHEAVGPAELAAHFGLQYNSAQWRLWKLKKEGLVEPLLSERGKWILSALGSTRLEYLRRKHDVNQ